MAKTGSPTLGNKTAGTVDARRMELDELHVLERESCPGHHGVPITRARVGRSA